MTKTKQDIVKWACLLHNIGKIGKPNIFGRDHIYPFNSALIALTIMLNLRLIELDGLEQERNFNEVLRLIEQSRKPLPVTMREDFTPGISVCTQMHSHHNLSMIFFLLWEKDLAPRGSFTDLVFRMVLFHRSLEGSELSPNLNNLTKTERLHFCDK